MSNFEMQLVSRIVRTGSIKEVIDWGLNLSDFKTPEARAYYKSIYEYFQNPATAGTVFGPHTIRTIYPQFQTCDDASATTEFLCGEVRKTRLALETREIAVDLVEKLEGGDVGGAIEQAQMALQKLIELGTRRNTDLNLPDGLDRIIAEYEMKERGVTTAIMPWPWDIMNEATGGLEPADYIVFYGRPKSMKTWALTYLIAWAFQQEKKALIYTKEMTQENIYKRVSACIARLPYQELRNAKLAPDERKALYDLRRMSADPMMRSNLVCLSGRDAGSGGDTVAWLRAKVDKYKPDVLFVDGMYLLSDDAGKKSQSDHVRVMNISRGLRDLALQFRIPVIATMQANRKAAGHSDANLDEIAYSDALAQDATIAIRTIADKHQPIMSFVIGGSREFKLEGFRCNAVPARDFSFHSVMTEKEAIAAKEQDAEEKAAAAAKAKKKKANGRSNGETSNADRLLNEHLENMGKH